MHCLYSPVGGGWATGGGGAAAVGSFLAACWDWGWDFLDFLLGELLVFICLSCSDGVRGRAAC